MTKLCEAGRSLRRDPRRLEARRSAIGDCHDISRRRTTRLIKALGGGWQPRGLCSLAGPAPLGSVRLVWALIHPATRNRCENAGRAGCAHAWSTDAPDTGLFT